MVFKGKKKKNAHGVWEDSETTIDAWPEVLYIKAGSWADDEGFIKAGATLVSINGAAVPTTFARAKDMLRTCAQACSAEKGVAVKQLAGQYAAQKIDKNSFFKALCQLVGKELVTSALQKATRRQR